MRKTLIRLSGALLVAAALQCEPAYAATHVYVRIAPPVAVVETPSPSVHPGWVWRPGYHRWVRSRYEWVHGAWIAPPHGRRTWVAGHWAHERRGYFWVGGHWAR
jgi:hypothetical protein